MLRRALQRLERYFAYVPELTLRGTPEHVGLAYEDLWLTPEDGASIHGWWMPGPGDPSEPRQTWVYFHGNGGNISTRLDGYRDIHFRLGANVLAIDYRGFGQSTGVLSEAGTYADARAAVMAALLRRNAGGLGPLVLLGVSMGAAIASRMAMEFEPDAIVLESAPPSFPELAPLHRPWTRYMPVRRLMQTRYETCAYLASVDVPALFVHGDMDEVVPLEFGRKTFRAANNPKHMWVVPGGTHDRPDKIDRDTYYGLVCEFLQRHTHSVAVPRTLRAAI